MLRMNFNFTNNTQKLPGTTFGHDGQDATNENSTTLPIEIYDPKVTTESFISLQYY